MEQAVRSSVLQLSGIAGRAITDRARLCKEIQGLLAKYVAVLALQRSLSRQE